MRVGYKNPSLGITNCHYSASLVMPISDLRGIFFYPALTLDKVVSSLKHNQQKTNSLFHRQEIIVSGAYIIFFEVGIPNLVCGCILGWRSRISFSGHSD